MAVVENNDGDETVSAGTDTSRSAGETLRLAREQQSLDLDAVSKRTRIPQRHLLAIEKGDFAALPGRTYAIGFAKNYARAVGVSENEIAELMREEMAAEGMTSYRPEPSSYEPAETVLIPPRMLAWGAAALFAILLVGYLVWRAMALESTDLARVTDTVAEEGAEETATGSAEAREGAQKAKPDPAQANANSPVVMTANDTVWLRIYEKDGPRLYEGEMQKGESFTVPADAKNPLILTGRPDALDVKVGDRTIPPLGKPDRSIADVPVSAAALLARPTENNEDDESDNDR